MKPQTKAPPSMAAGRGTNTEVHIKGEQTMQKLWTTEKLISATTEALKLHTEYSEEEILDRTEYDDVSAEVLAMLCKDD